MKFTLSAQFYLRLAILPFIWTPFLAPSQVAATVAVATQDSASSEDVDSLDQQLDLLNKKVEVTKKEVNRIRDATYLPDLYFALADMYVQKSRLLYLLKIAKNPDRKTEDLDFTAEKRPKLDAIEIYQKIYSFFPKEKRRDKALFLQGLEQRDLGLFEQMVRTFSSLSTEFPLSPNFNEANIILGDYMFEQKKNTELAIGVFKKIIDRPLSPFTPLANYRLGWCYMSLNDYEHAIKAFESAIDTQGMTNADDLPEVYRKTDIKREAVISLAVPYIEVFTDPEKAGKKMLVPIEYFQGKSPDHFTFRRVMSRVGRRLILKEKWALAADAFFNVLVLSTDFDSRFEALQRVNEAHQKKESQVAFLPFVREIGITVDLLQASMPKPIVFTAATIVAIDRNSQLLKSKGKAEKNNSLLKKPANQLQFLEAILRDFATQAHGKARASGSADDFDDAAESYEIYISRFPLAPKALDMEYNMAEALFKGNHLVKAGMQYEVLSRDRRLAKRSNVFKELAIESYTKALQTIETLSSIEKIRARRGLRVVAGDWLKTNAKAQSAPATSFNIANSWYEERNLRKAIEAFQIFIKTYPQDDHIRDAIFLTINAYSQMDDYKGLQKAGVKLVSTAGLSDADRTTIKDAIKRAATRQLQNTAGDFGTKEYAENLLSVASKYKNSQLGVQALYEAFISLKSKRDPEVFDVGDALLNQHADSQYSKEIASTMATLALSTASFERAARYLSRYAEKYPAEKESPEFMKTSAVLYERQGDFKRAHSSYAKIGDRLSLARMDLAMNDWSHLESSSLASGAPEASYWHALAIWRQHRYQDAAPLLKALASSPAAPKDQVGHALFLLSQLSLDRFHSIQMKSAEDQQALGEKVKAFQVLSDQLHALIQTGAGRWPIAALYMLGQSHYDLGRFIADSPLPKGLSAVDKQTYIGELNKQAGAYLAEAEKVFGKCTEAAQANDVFTHYVEGCRGHGQKIVREEDDLVKPQAKSVGAEPPKARAIRKQLFEKSTDLPLLFELGESYIRADQPLTAGGIFARILEIEPTNARAIASIGVASMFSADYDAAYDSFKKALDVDPKDATAIWNLSGLYKQFGFKTKLATYRTRMAGVKPPALLHPFAQRF